MSVVALAGNPNCGKTTLFNKLTGLNQKVGNYPGVTVERRSGSANFAGRAVTVVDLPGTYSLISRSRDEAMEWSRRYPNPTLHGSACEIEVLQLFEAEDFAPASS